MMSERGKCGACNGPAELMVSSETRTHAVLLLCRACAESLAGELGLRSLARMLSESKGQRP
jgi:hypothetical protein